MAIWVIIAVLAAAWVFRPPARWVAAVLAGLWAAIIAVLLAAPDGAVARAIGGDWRGWLVGGGIAALALGYRAALGQLRRAAPPPQAAPDALTPHELDRYARQMVLRDIGGAGQARLRGARVLVVGAGGLGSPLCLYLAGAGVGQITVADDDRVSLSNLHRQVIFRDADTGRPKAQAAAQAMAALNGHIRVTALDRRITAEDSALILNHDLVIDGSDSFASRSAVNRACVAAGVPLLAGAISQWDGQVTLYHPASGAPCLACLFPEAPARAMPCAQAGVAGPLPGIIGSLMALEAIKHLTGAGTGLHGRMVLFDGLYGETRSITVARRPDCPVCGHGA